MEINKSKWASKTLNALKVSPNYIYQTTNTNELYPNYNTNAVPATV